MRIIIVGCGRLGSGLAQEMTLKGHDVTVVDSDPGALEMLGPGFKGRRVVGIGFDQDVLNQAGIQRADGLAAVTTSDEANVVIARIAKQIYHVPKVVARLYDPSQAEVYSRLGLQTIAPISWGIHQIASILLQSRIDTVSSIGTSDVDLVVIEAPYLLAGKTVGSLVVSGELHVIAITRGGRTFLPTPGSTFEEGDLVHLAVLATSKSRLEQLLNEAGG